MLDVGNLVRALSPVDNEVALAKTNIQHLTSNIYFLLPCKAYITGGG
jgi:hypothetical protein